MVFVVGISPRRRAGNLFSGVLGAFYECLLAVSAASTMARTLGSGIGGMSFCSLTDRYHQDFLVTQRSHSYLSHLSIGCAVSKQDPLLADIFPRCRTLFAQLR